jgi:hypothetical protein
MPNEEVKLLDIPALDIGSPWFESHPGKWKILPLFRHIDKKKLTKKTPRIDIYFIICLVVALRSSMVQKS